MATAAQVAREAQRQNALVAAAREELRAIWRTLPLADPEAARDMLMELVPALVDKYGQAAGFAAAEFYDSLRADSTVARAFSALVADADLDGVRASTRRLAGVLFGDDPEAMLTGLDAVLDKQVKQVYRNTVQGSARIDPVGPRYARVPQGDTCSWCLMLASRGFVYASAESAAGESSRYHHACDCVPTPDFSDSPALDGYDPDALYEQYRATVTG